MSLPAPKAMILAAGRGTRLAPLTDTTPKPMLPLNGKPLIQWQIEALVRCGVREVIINLHHLGEVIENFLTDGSAFGVSIQYSREQALLETGGGIVKALPLLGDAPFWLLNGDIWTDFDFASLPIAPSNPNLVHMVLTATPESRDHGDFEYAHGSITARGESHVYCGIACVTPSVFGGRKVEPFSWNEIFFDLVNQGLVSAQIHNGTWHDIGTLAQYQKLTSD